MTKKEPKEKRTGNIIEAAISEFIEKGYENASMESIAARAGLTKGGLYYHFASKENILIRANEKFMEPVISFMSAAMNEKNAAKGLEGYIRQYLSHWAAHPRELSFIFLTMTRVIGNRELGRMFDGYVERIVSFLEGLYRRGIESGRFREMPAGSAATALMAALDGIIGYLVLDSSLPLEGTIGRFIEIFVKDYRT